MLLRWNPPNWQKIPSTLFQYCYEINVCFTNWIIMDNKKGKIVYWMWNWLDSFLCLLGRSKVKNLNTLLYNFIIVYLLSTHVCCTKFLEKSLLIFNNAKFEIILIPLWISIMQKLCNYPYWWRQCTTFENKMQQYLARHSRNFFDVLYKMHYRKSRKSAFHVKNKNI